MVKVRSHVPPLRSFKLIAPILFFRREKKRLHGWKFCRIFRLHRRKIKKIFEKFRWLVSTKTIKYDRMSATLLTEIGRWFRTLTIDVILLKREPRLRVKVPNFSAFSPTLYKLRNSQIYCRIFKDFRQENFVRFVIFNFGQLITLGQ